jgi:flagellar basal-body rod protein FlgC
MSLLSALSVSASGLSAQRTRSELLVENLANSETTRTAEGGPYRRKDAIFESTSVPSAFASELDNELGGSLTGVTVADITVDSGTPERRYLPGHPDADADGYVAMPRVNPAQDMVDLMGASRSFEANVAAISAVKDMIQRSIDLLK